MSAPGITRRGNGVTHYLHIRRPATSGDFENADRTACSGSAALSPRGKSRHCFSMSGTLTIHQEPELLRPAGQGARARHTTLPEVITDYLRVMARNWQDNQNGRTPVTDALRGAVTLPRGFDERAILMEELQRRHGVQG